MNDNQLIVPSEAELERFVMPPPQSIGLEVTMRCNLQCPMCATHAKIPHSRFVGNDMKLKVVDLLGPTLQTAREVELSGGGEPFLLPYFADFVDKCHEYNPTIDVTTISNGVLLSERRARMAIEKRMHLIDFSIDGTIQYGHVGGGADYDKTRNNLRRLARLKEEYGVEEPRIAIAFVAMRDNLCELPDLIEFAGEIGAAVRIQPLAPVTREQRSQNVFRHVDYTLRVLDDCKVKAQQVGVKFDYTGMTDGLDQNPRNCGVPDKWLWVGHNGELRPCCGGMTTGRNIYEKSLSIEKIWNSSPMRKLRWELDTGNHNDVCKRCPMACNTIENQERAIPSDPLEQQITQLENRILELETHLDGIRRGKVMQILRGVDRLLGRE
jgi:radical SAM protein with 4Fe4S-binding SPASM domain